MPQTGRVVPELGRDDVRQVLLRTYRIIYLVHHGGITVLTVFEGHRRLPEETHQELATIDRSET
jgi:plasmid stabilization system protein ParE